MENGQAFGTNICSIDSVNFKNAYVLRSAGCALTFDFFSTFV